MKTEFYCYGCLQHKHIDLLGTRKTCKSCDEKAIKKTIEQNKSLTMNKKNTQHYKKAHLSKKLIKYFQDF